MSSKENRNKDRKNEKDARKKSQKRKERWLKDNNESRKSI